MEQRLSKKVMILTGAGQIGMAIARRIGSGMKIVIGDKNIGNAHAIARTMNQAGFDTLKPFLKWISTEPPYCWKRWGKLFAPAARE